MQGEDGNAAHGLVTQAEALLDAVRGLAGAGPATAEDLALIAGDLDALIRSVRELSHGARTDGDARGRGLAESVAKGVAAARAPGIAPFWDLDRLERRAGRGDWEDSETRELVIALAWHLGAQGLGGIEDEIDAALREFDSPGPRPF